MEQKTSERANVSALVCELWEKSRLSELIENYQPQQALKKKGFDYKDVSKEKHRQTLEKTNAIATILISTIEVV